MDNWKLVPKDIFFLFLKLLSPLAILPMRQICKNWKELVDSYLTPEFLSTFTGHPFISSIERFVDATRLLKKSIESPVWKTEKHLLQVGNDDNIVHLVYFPKTERLGLCFSSRKFQLFSLFDLKIPLLELDSSHFVLIGDNRRIYGSGVKTLVKLDLETGDIIAKIPFKFGGHLIYAFSSTNAVVIITAHIDHLSYHWSFGNETDPIKYHRLDGPLSYPVLENFTRAAFTRDKIVVSTLLGLSSTMDMDGDIHFFYPDGKYTTMKKSSTIHFLAEMNDDVFTLYIKEKELQFKSIIGNMPLKEKPPIPLSFYFEEYETIKVIPWGLSGSCIGIGGWSCGDEKEQVVFINVPNEEKYLPCVKWILLKNAKERSAPDLKGISHFYKRTIFTPYGIIAQEDVDTENGLITIGIWLLKPVNF